MTKTVPVKEIRALIREVELKNPRKNVLRFIDKLNGILELYAPRPLADMSFDQRNACAGMWADVYRPESDYVITCVVDNPNFDWDEKLARILWVGDGFFNAAHENVIPRFDLKRAWNADRQPEEKDEE